MRDRGMIKWAPFDSVIATNKLKKDISKQKSKISMPILSEDQLRLIELNLLNAFHNQDLITITYYKSGGLYTITDYIKSINSINKQVILSNNITIYFNQITNTKIN